MTGMTSTTSRISSTSSTARVPDGGTHPGTHAVSHRPDGGSASTERVADGDTNDGRATDGHRSRGRRTEPGAQTAVVRALALAVFGSILVLAVGGTVVLSRSTVYEASVDVLVTPASGASDADAASLFDSLSKGQVAATAAEIYRQRQWQGTRDGSVEAGVVTPSAVVQVSARASSALAAQELVKAVVAAAGPTVNRTLAPYQASRLDSGDPAAAPVGLSRGLQLVLTLLAALVVGGAVLRLAYPKPKIPAD